jgi:rhodanese-related sulfurtransferase
MNMTIDSMKRNSFLVILIALAFVITNCDGQKSGSQPLSTDSFEKKLTATTDKIILDVRTPDEYANGHLAESILINYYDGDFKNQVSKLDKSKPVFVYCKGGVRSASAAKILTEAGFKEVYDLQGGFDSWAGARKPVIK